MGSSPQPAIHCQRRASLRAQYDGCKASFGSKRRRPSDSAAACATAKFQGPVVLTAHAYAAMGTNGKSMGQILFVGGGSMTLNVVYSSDGIGEEFPSTAACSSVHLFCVRFAENDSLGSSPQPAIHGQRRPPSERSATDARHRLACWQGRRQRSDSASRRPRFRLPRLYSKGTHVVAPESTSSLCSIHGE